MQNYTNNVTDRAGNVISGATVTVTVNGTGAIATIYSDNGSSIQGNPMSTDQNGQFSFYAANGKYNITATSKLLASSIVYPTITLFDPTDANAVAATSVSAADGSAGSLWTTAQGFINKIISSAGASVVGYLPPGTGALTKTVKDELDSRPSIPLARFLTAAQLADIAAGTKIYDIKPALDLAIAVASVIGGFVDLPAGQLKLLGMVQMSTGVGLRGQGQINSQSASREGVTSLFGAHTGSAILSLKGCLGCTLLDFSLEAGVGAVPKTGLLLGRSSAASAGYHKIMRIAVYGYYSLAPIYSIASEDNHWSDINVWLFGGGAKYCLYTGISDALTSGLTLTTSSNLDNTWYRPFFINSSVDANAAVIFIQGAQAVGSWSFMGGYLTAAAGSYVQIDNGTIDALDCLGPFTFVGMSGEILAGGDPIYGIRLTSTAGRTLPGLTVLGSRFDFVAGANHYQILQDPNLTLESPNIHIRPPEAFPYALCSVIRNQIKNGNVTVGRAAEWAAITLAGTWSNNYGAPYAQASYSVDGFGVLRVRGTVGGGTGAIFTLPTDLRPSVNMFIPVYATAGMGRVLITAATGVVSLSAGTATEVDLSTIQFKIT